MVAGYGDIKILKIDVIHDLLKTIQNEHFPVEDLNKKNDTSPNFKFDI